MRSFITVRDLERERDAALASVDSEQRDTMASTLEFELDASWYLDGE